MSIISPNPTQNARRKYHNTALTYNQNQKNTNKYPLKSSLTPVSSGVKSTYAEKMLKRSQSVLSEAVSEAPLGTIGKSFRHSSETIVLHALKPPKDKASEEFKKEKENYQKSRQRRYDLQRTLIKLFKGKETPKGASFNFHNCKRAPINKGENVDIVYSPSTTLAHYHNLQTCQKNACPHCAESKAIINKQILEALKACHARAGGGVIMLTLTNSHHLGMDLKDHLNKQAEAVTKFNKALSKMEFWAEFGGRLGAVRAWEVTYGVNGWHPHFHFLLYMSKDLTERDENGKALEEQPVLEKIRNSLSEEWITACTNAGLPAPSEEHGVDVRDGTHADRYVGKFGDEIINMNGGWGSSDEITRSHLKTDKEPPKSLSEAKLGGKGLTPWQLLQLAHEGCKKSGELFIEYVYGTYGKSQLYFYPGTKSLYDLEAEIEAMKEEQEALNAEQYEDKALPENRLFMTLPPLMWKAITFSDKRAQLLTLAEKDAENGDFEHKHNAMALINNCLKAFLDHLEKAQDDKERKEQIHNTLIDTEIDTERRKKGEYIAPDVDVKFLSPIEKKLKRRLGSKSLNDGLEILNAVNNIKTKKSVSEIILEPIPDWVNEVPPLLEIPEHYQIYS